MDREVINRNIINIIDVKNQQNFQIFNTEDLFNILHNYLSKLVENNPEAKNYIDNSLDKNRALIEKIARNENINIYEKNDFMNILMDIKRKYLM